MAGEEPAAEARAQDVGVLPVVVVALVEISYSEEKALDLIREWRNIDAARAEDDKDSRKKRRAGTTRLQVQIELTKAYTARTDGDKDLRKT